MPWIVLPRLEMFVLYAAFLVSLITLATLPRAGRDPSSPPLASARWLELGCLAANVVALVFVHARTFAAWEEARGIYFARIGLALFAIFEQLPALLLATGVLLPIAAVAAAVRWWKRGRARGAVLSLAVAVFVVGAVAPFVGTARAYVEAVADANVLPDGVDGPALERARSRFRLGARVASLALVGSVVLIGLARRRDAALVPGRMTAPSWTLTLGLVAVGAAGVVVLSGRARALAAENAHPIPTTHAFADVSLSIEPPLGVEGVGPDDVVEGPLVDVRLDEVTIDGTRTEKGELLGSMLRSKRELRAWLDPSLPPAVVNVDVDPSVPIEQLARALDAVRASRHDDVRFRLVDIRREQRPVLGVLRGLSWSAVAATLVARASECATSPVHVARLSDAPGTSEDLLRELIAARRAQLPICIVTRER